MADVMPTRRSAATRTSTRNASANSNSKATKKDDAKELDIEIISIDEQTSMYKRANGTEMERQTGIGFCEALNCEVIITRSLVDKDGNDKIEMSDNHIGQTFPALVSKVPAKNGKGFIFFAEISLSRVQLASEASVNLFDSL